MQYIAVGYCFGLHIYKAYAFFFFDERPVQKFCTSFKTEFILFLTEVWLHVQKYTLVVISLSDI